MSVYYSALVFCRSSPQMEKRGILANFDARDLVLESLELRIGESGGAMG